MHVDDAVDELRDKGLSINDVGNWEGEGSKIGQNCQRIILKKLPTWGRGVSKIRRRLWMVPKVIFNEAKAFLK